MMNAKSLLGIAASLALAFCGMSHAGAQATYGHTDFQASGSRAAQEIFVKGLLQLHNFEYDDARASFLAAQDEDPDFVMAYWGEALTHEHPLWDAYDTNASRAALAKLAATAEGRVAKAPTAREKAYIDSVNVLFGEGTQDERELRYADALAKIHADYPEDLDAAALYALALLTTSHGGRDFSIYMRAGAVTEEILDKDPLHPGALHYNIHSYDDPIHAPLGLRAADAYVEVAPSAVHALHMGSHIYFALGMWELGSERNQRAFEEAIARQESPDAQYGGQAYHSLTWLIYSLTQQGKHAEAQERLELIEEQLKRYGGPMNTRNFINARASYIVDTQDWDSRFADVEVDYRGQNAVTIATDQYVAGVRALRHGDAAAAKVALAQIGGEEPMSSGNRQEMVPRLLHLGLAAQIELDAGRTEQAVSLLEEAVALEASVPPEYGPAVPVQPMGELLADVYRSLGETELAKTHYESALAAYVGRERSLQGLSKLSR